MRQPQCLRGLEKKKIKLCSHSDWLIWNFRPGWKKQKKKKSLWDSKIRSRGTHWSAPIRRLTLTVCTLSKISSWNIEGSVAAQTRGRPREHSKAASNREGKSGGGPKAGGGSGQDPPHGTARSDQGFAGTTGPQVIVGRRRPNHSFGGHVSFF